MSNPIPNPYADIDLLCDALAVAIAQMLDAGSLVLSDAAVAIIDNRSAPYAAVGTSEVFEAAARVIASRGVTN